MDYALLWTVGTGILVAGGAAGAVKVTLNGTRERVKELEAQSTDHGDRLARIETKLDFLVSKANEPR